MIKSPWPPIGLVVLCTALAPAATVAQTPEQSLFAWTDLQFSPVEYETRRGDMTARLAAAGGGIFLIPSGEGLSGGETFRVLDNFNYFVGLELPNSVVVLDADTDRTILFIPDTDFRFESAARPNDFPGRKLGEDPELLRKTGVDEVRDISDLAGFVADVVGTERSLWIDWGRRGVVEPVRPGPIHNWNAGQRFTAWLQADHPQVTIHNAYDHVAHLRMVKSAAEIALMRRVARITTDGIRAAARGIRGGVEERALEGVLELEFKRAGAQRPAFASIIKSGPNSLWPWRILASHYDRGNRAMHDGELVIFDVGAELDYYSSDVGRTFPVSGRFTDRQRAILEMEIAVADAIIEAVRPGVTFRDLRAAADRAIPDEHRPYMQASLFFGHHIGLTVGDPNLQDAPLKAGMIFTVEPWYYNHDQGISVFTEDEILVTEDGAELLTAGLPRSADGLERLVNAR